VYKWQVFLGGIASATFVLAGAAAPALAQTVASSPLTSVTQAVTGSQVTANVCDMAGSPLSGEVNSAMAGLTGQSCSGSNTSTPQNASQTTSMSNGTAQNASTPASSPASTTPMTTALPGLSAVTGEIPGLSSMSSTLPDLNSATSQAPAQSPASSFVSAPDSAPLSNATVPSLSSNEPGSGSTAVQNTLNGVTGTLPVSSLTGGLPDLSNVTGALSGVTGPQD
jgi:hypothetical protein